jgi:hypothetical protein
MIADSKKEERERMIMCVCEREREREKENDRKWQRGNNKLSLSLSLFFLSLPQFQIISPPPQSVNSTQPVEAFSMCWRKMNTDSARRERERERVRENNDGSCCSFWSSRQQASWWISLTGRQLWLELRVCECVCVCACASVCVRKCVRVCVNWLGLLPAVESCLDSPLSPLPLLLSCVPASCAPAKWNKNFFFLPLFETELAAIVE